ncbi:lasso RiPP family leader peptide-containing protein [Nonomuraea purpurea]|uniref:Lasso RiPP family leader peptide-containing protein n=1 Tax=Nonomuraea purpurea TaxID=1849276 RepID=A0ABV8GRB9_9ACTN
MEPIPQQEVYEPPAMIEIGGFADHTLGGVAGQFDGGTPPSVFFPTWW